jgi:hypothetical protein
MAGPIARGPGLIGVCALARQAVQCSAVQCGRVAHEQHRLGVPAALFMVGGSWGGSWASWEPPRKVTLGGG